LKDKAHILEDVLCESQENIAFLDQLSLQAVASNREVHRGQINELKKRQVIHQEMVAAQFEEIKQTNEKIQELEGRKPNADQLAILKGKTSEAKGRYERKLSDKREIEKALEERAMESLKKGVNMKSKEEHSIAL
jgi:hypothetical protein